MNFYISLEKRIPGKFCDLRNSMSDLHKIWHDYTERVSQVQAFKNFNFTNPRSRAADARRSKTDALETSVLLRRQISRFFDFQDGGCPLTRVPLRT